MKYLNNLINVYLTLVTHVNSHFLSHFNVSDDWNCLYLYNTSLKLGWERISSTLLGKNQSNFEAFICDDYAISSWCELVDATSSKSSQINYLTNYSNIKNKLRIYIQSGLYHYQRRDSILARLKRYNFNNESINHIMQM